QKPFYLLDFLRFSSRDHIELTTGMDWNGFRIHVYGSNKFTCRSNRFLTLSIRTYYAIAWIH
ncbi:MAG: hypothetical protein K9K64_06610, partial [Desulfohalobiaceae bacterium]|nr:hypothetical protein [Desulfohalobiaceae bacterium]